MWRDTLLMVGKDLRIEARSRVALSQVAPFGVIALVLFAFALGPDRSPMAKAAPGLFWVAVLFSTVLAIQRSVSVESVDGARDGLRLSGLDPAGVFLGKTAAVAVQLVILEAILGVGVVLLYGARMNSVWLAVVACVAGTIGLAAAGTLYGALSPGCGCERPCCPSCCCRWWLPCCWPALASGKRRWPVASPARGRRGSACSSSSTRCISH